ncbi:MAG TPA: hypothetical protein VNW92_15580 [Polyangiaceae bacterium]|jgi:hypothetical protein|nr:hypothetical protein [Polyangiaceae bacterium]
MARPTLTPIALSLALLAGACTGKGVAGSCADIGACGGDPQGSWLVQSTCQFDVTPPPLSQVLIAAGYTTPQTPALANPPPSNTVSGEWCENLDYSTDSNGQSMSNGQTMVAVSLFAGGPLEYQLGGTMSFDPNTGNYTATLKVQHDFATHFTPGCINAHGAYPTCQALTDSISGYLSGAFVNYNNFACTPSSDGGCDCTYRYGEGVGETARYAVMGNELYILDAMSGLPPHAYDFCIQGDTMTVGGHNGSHLFGSAGLRSMVMTRCSGQTCNLNP